MSADRMGIFSSDDPQPASPQAQQKAEKEQRRREKETADAQRSLTDHRRAAFIRVFKVMDAGGDQVPVSDMVKMAKIYLNSPKFSMKKCKKLIKDKLDSDGTVFVCHFVCHSQMMYDPQGVETSKKENSSCFLQR